MPNGFLGNAAAKYIGHASRAHTKAMTTMQESTMNANFGDSSGAARAVKMPSMPRQRALPFSEEDAHTGRFITGRGDSSNIVVDEDECLKISRAISDINYNMDDCMYCTAAEIEEMCRTIFILPTVTSQCMNFCDTVKSSLVHFRDLTEDMSQEVRKFALKIAEIGL